MLSILKLFSIFISAFILIYLLMLVSGAISRFIERKFFKGTKNNDNTNQTFGSSENNRSQDANQDVIEITDYEIKNNNSSDDISH